MSLLEKVMRLFGKQPLPPAVPPGAKSASDSDDTQKVIEDLSERQHQVRRDLHYLEISKRMAEIHKGNRT